MLEKRQQNIEKSVKKRCIPINYDIQVTDILATTWNDNS